MKNTVFNSLLWTIWTLGLYLNCVTGFSTGAPANSCKDPSTFHTRKMNATHEGIILPKDMSTNPYRLIVGDSHFTSGQEISVSLETSDPKMPLEGFFIQAVQANIAIRDLSREAFGTFKNTTSRERPSSCQSRDLVKKGGITHTDALPKRKVTVVWVAPSESDPGNVQFLATGVQKYDIYWTDIRSHLLESRNYTDRKGSDRHTTTDRLSPTAIWYIWLHNLLHPRTENSTPQTSNTVK